VALRKQLGYLRAFIDRFDLVKTKPEPGRVVGGVPPGGSVQLLTDGAAYGVYLRRQTGAGSFSARWTGLLRFPIAGTYQLHITSNDGVRVKSGTRTLFEDWTDHAAKTDTVTIDSAATGTVAAFPPARALPITVEYFYTGGSGVMTLAWTRPDGVRETVPVEAWRTSRDGVPGLQAAYFHGVSLKEAWFSRLEPTLENDFGSNGPRRSEPASAPPAPASLDLRLPAGTYGVMWTNPLTNDPIHASTVMHGGGVAHLKIPRWGDDVAVYIRRDEPAAARAPRQP
jgi:hypothetical protein